MMLRVSDDDIMVVGRYAAGNSKQQWVIERDQICCESNRQLTVAVDGSVRAGATCKASADGNDNCWLFDHE